MNQSTCFVLSGVLYEDGTINNKASIARLAEISVNYAKAGLYLQLSEFCFITVL